MKKLTKEVLYWFNDQYIPHHDYTRGYRVYRNLHDKCWSVQGWMPDKGWRVIGLCHAFRALDCDFVVNENARRRVVAERKKNVHAFIFCKDIVLAFDGANMPSTEVTYSPYTDPDTIVGSFGVGTFYIDGPDLAISGADMAVGTRDHRIFVS